VSTLRLIVNRPAADEDMRTVTRRVRLHMAHRRQQAAAESWRASHPHRARLLDWASEVRAAFWRLFTVLVVLALFSGSAQAEERKGLSKAERLLPIAANLADAVATDYAIHRHGAREANPFLAPVVGNRALHYGTKAAIGIVTSAAGQHLAKRGNRRMAKVVVFLGSALAIGAAAHNVSLGR
jgi:hypothetical protein